VYISLFLVTVLTPRIIREGFEGGVNQEVAEMLVLFVVGLIGLILYNWKDVEGRRRLEEKRELARKSSDAQRDLASSYTYIGALNRKIDILKEIILSVPREIQTSRSRKDSPYMPIIEAMRLFGDCRDVLIGFYRTNPSEKVLFETASRVGFDPDIDRSACTSRKHVTTIHQENYTIICTKRRIKGVSVYGILRRNRIKSQDADLIKALLVQALFLYIALRSSRKRPVKRGAERN